MKRVLVAYATNAGSTAEIAARVADAVQGPDTEVELRTVRELGSAAPALEGYDAVIVGAPMILGWHRQARRFLRRNRSALAAVPLALFLVGMQLTADSSSEEEPGLPVTVDPRILKQPADPARLRFRERFTTLGAYLRPLRPLLRAIQPKGAAFFAGKLDYSRLKIPQMLFVMLVVAARPSDQRNWDLIRSWSSEMRSTLLSGRGRTGGSA